MPTPFAKRISLRILAIDMALHGAPCRHCYTPGDKFRWMREQEPPLAAQREKYWKGFGNFPGTATPWSAVRRKRVWKGGHADRTVGN